MKFDIKSIIILVLLAFGIIFFGIWYFKTDDTKSKLKLIEEKNIRIESQRDSLKLVNSDLLVKFNDIQKGVNSRDSLIKNIEYRLQVTKNELKSANDKVAKNQKDLDETKKKIQSLKDNPINREGDDLINSLKEKLK